MKKILCLFIIVCFLAVTGCATNTGRGAGIGAGAGTIASVIAGKSGTTAALLIMGGALLGGAIGHTMDQQAQHASTLPENRNKTVMIVEEHPNTGSTNCHKVTKKKWRNGKKISEKTDEVCTGNKKTQTY